ncbi:hypothetical protein GLOIN_2v1480991 [Rhizophagus irregularis DAOM 181602=DAOM 197198]|nr:hypothetical protein GLOIN_2v1480991 [Rhizophagus irregularis DAOM 181602=DAOM 197198]
MIYRVQYTFANLKGDRFQAFLAIKKKNERRRSFQKPRKRKKVLCYCNNCNGKLVLERTKLLHETGGETNDSNKDESNKRLNFNILPSS